MDHVYYTGQGGRGLSWVPGATGGATLDWIMSAKSSQQTLVPQTKRADEDA